MWGRELGWVYSYARWSALGMIAWNILGLTVASTLIAATI